MDQNSSKMTYSNPMDAFAKQFLISSGLYNIGNGINAYPVRAKGIFQCLPVRVDFNGPIRKPDESIVHFKGKIICQIVNCLN